MSDNGKTEVKYWRSIQLPNIPAQYGNDTCSMTLTSLSETGKESEEFERIKTLVDESVEKRSSEIWERFKIDLSGLRVRTKDGKKYPSVTSILNPTELKIDPNYAVRGTEIHRILSHMIDKGVWLEPKADIGSLKYDDIKYKEFYEANKEALLISSQNVEVYHDRLMYSGEVDALGLMDKKKTVIDFKTGAMRKEHLMQVVAYAKALDYPQVCICDLKTPKLYVFELKDVKCIEAWEEFLIKRGEIRSKFGI